jgi:hypothetical protein
MTVKAVLTVLALLQLIPNNMVNAITVAGFCCALIYLFLLWKRLETDAPAESTFWPIAVTSAIAVVTSPHTHYHDALILAIAAALTVKSLDFRGIASDQSLSYRIWCALLLFYPTLSWLCYIYRNATIVPALGIINLCLALAAIAHCERIIRPTEHGA